jgi:hypothetical protein
MLIQPSLREHPGWEFGNNCSAGHHFKCLKAISRRQTVRHLRSLWPEKLNGICRTWDHDGRIGIYSIVSACRIVPQMPVRQFLTNREY